MTNEDLVVWLLVALLEGSFGNKWFFFFFFCLNSGWWKSKEFV